jgi:hypothetical protein
MVAVTMEVHRRSWLSIFFLFSLGACSVPATGKDAGGSTLNLVRVELSYTRGGGEALRFDAQAHFVRARDFDPSAVPTLLGFPDFDGVALDSCRVSDGTAVLDDALADGMQRQTAEVALLDAGHLELHGADTHSPLVAHHYPELVPFVSGVVYGVDEGEGLPLTLGQSYTVFGDGGEEVGPFQASASAPQSFPELQSPVLRRGAPLELRWSSEGGGADPLLIEVKWSSRSGGRAVRCRLVDDGQFTIGRESFETLPPAGQLANMTVLAMRVGRGPFEAPGVGRGELAIELRDATTLQVVP